MTDPTSKYFLKYQADWINDRSLFKIAEKSRRTGFTYCQSYEDVRDAASDTDPMDVWFSSADESAAKEYIRYCGHWAKILNIAAEDLGEVVIDKDKDIKALSIEFATGKRINALSSNPKAFRSKGGKLVLDEYAFHADQEAMWKAALPIVTWGYPVRIISTYNGKGNRYYRLVQDAKEGRGNWNLHTVDIETAVEHGLADKILGRLLTWEERLTWLKQLEESVGDPDTWQQEYMCQPMDEATAWLSWDLITRNEHADAGDPELYQGARCYVGWDIARRRDLSVIWVVEQVGDVFWTREVVRMKNWKFAAQDAEFDRVMDQYIVLRACLDQTGMGEKVVEDAQQRHGTLRVEGVAFTSAVKQELATIGKRVFEDNRARIPASRELRESHHAVRKTTTAAGNPRFDAERTEAGHADEFWAHMLALHAATDHAQPSAGATVTREDGVAGQLRNRRPRMHMGRSAGRGNVFGR